MYFHDWKFSITGVGKKRALAVYVRSRKKSQKNEKWDWMKIQSENTFLRTRQELSRILFSQTCPKLYFAWLFSNNKISYFYDIEILCEKQSYFHCVPRGKEDYCINIYMILMLIFAKANPARVSFRWTLCVSLPLSVWLINFIWNFSKKLYFVSH